ncbi:MAG: acyltransferase [Lysobacteraceae bacterium]
MDRDSTLADPRIAQDGARQPALSGLRGIAALGVFAVHAYALAGLATVSADHPTLSFLLAWPSQMGWAGVDLFFTLSAFLLALPFARANLQQSTAPNLRGYAARRLLRILPAYYVQLAVLLILIASGLDTGLISPPAVPMARLLVQPFFLYDLGWPGVATTQFPLIGSWWTLPVELSFYALLPWLARLLRPGRWRWLLLGVAFAWSWRAALLWTHSPSPAIDYLAEHLPGRIDQFVIGMLAAYALCRAPTSLAWLSGRKADLVFVLGALVFLLLPILGYRHGWPMGTEPRREWWLIGWHSYASVAVAAMLFAACRATRWISASFGSLPLRLLGQISYGFYLWHLPVLLWMHAHGGVVAAGGALAFVFTGLIFSLLLAIVSWVVVERPALSLVTRWRRRAVVASGERQTPPR